MRCMTIRMQWAKEDDKWHMIAQNGFFLYDFFDCENVNKFFGTLDKGTAKYYEITCREIKNK